VGKITRNDPIFSGLPKDFESVLPPSGVLNGKLVSPLFASLEDANLAALVLENGNTVAAQLGREIAADVGWPTHQLEQLGSLVQTAFQNVPAQLIAKVIRTAGNLIPDALRDMEKAVAETISGVPLLGWIVKLGLLVWDIVALARARVVPRNATAEALGYERDNDSFVTDTLLGGTSQRNWTNFFLPPKGSFKLVTLAYTNSGVEDGIGWGQIGLSSDDIGLVPGVGQIVGYWQSPHDLPGSSRPAGAESIVAGNQLYPSATSLSALLWTNAQKPGSQTLGSIDLNAIVSAWQDYGDALEEFAAHLPYVQGHGTEWEHWLQSQIRTGWRWYDEYTGAGYYGVDPSDVPQQWRHPGLDSLVGWRVNRAKQAVWKGLATISCAYMGPSTPVLSDPDLRARWELMRVKLLAHPARAEVDTALIPDAEYRSAMHAAQLSASTDIASLEKPKPKRWPMPTVDDSPAPPDPEPPDLPTPSGWSDKRGRNTAIAVGAGVATTAVLAYVFRDQLRSFYRSMRK
jgi:hypothetical protein